jgi:putative ABC transport system substrate-binding protein
MARAQQRAMPVIGFLNSGSADVLAEQLRAFHKGLGEAGFIEGRNVAIEYRWAEGQYDRLPGGNVTGVNSMNMELIPKRMELLHELIPNAPSMAFLVNPSNPGNVYRTIEDDLNRAARILGLEVHAWEASNDRALDNAFTKSAELRAGGLLASTDPFFSSRSEKIAELSLRHAVPFGLSDSRVCRGWGANEFGKPPNGSVPCWRWLCRPHS